MEGSADSSSDYTALEEEFRRYATNGTRGVFICARARAARELGRTDLKIRAHIIRDLMILAEANNRDVQLKGATITGELDLSGLICSNGLLLGDCNFDGPVKIENSRFPWISFRGSRLRRLNARNVETSGDLDLYGTTVEAEEKYHGNLVAKAAAVNLSGARIRGQLRLEHATVSSKFGSAIFGPSLRIEGSANLDYAEITGNTDDAGAVQLTDASITGSLYLTGAKVENRAGPGIMASRLEITGTFSLDSSSQARTEVTGTGHLGAVSLVSAQIGSRLTCRGALLQNPSGPALRAYGATAGSGMFLDRDPDVNATDRMFEARGGGDRGAVRLDGCTIGGILRLNAARLENPEGPALYADGMRVEGPVFMNGGFSAKGRGSLGAVRLLEVQVRGRIDMRDCHVENSQGPSILAWNARVGAELVFDSSSYVDGLLDLSSMTVGRLCFDPAQFPRGAAVTIDGLSYGGLARTKPEDGGRPLTAEEGLRWLARMSYAAQPYQHLAAAFRAGGHEGDARKVLIAQQDRLTGSGSANGSSVRYLDGWAAFRHRILGATIGYGYQSWRALLLLGVVLLLAIGLGVGAGQSRHALGEDPAGRRVPCSVVQEIGLGVDLGLPLIKTGARDHCDVTASDHLSQLLVAGGWVLQILAWAFSALFVAGFTGVIRRP